MKYSNVLFEVTEEPCIIEASENINSIEFINLGDTKLVINNSMELDGRSTLNGINRIKFEAGTDRIFENDFTVRDYCDDIQCYLFKVLIIKTVLR